jgi:tetratricopeptide (TPR) repeat protein
VGSTPPLVRGPQQYTQIMSWRRVSLMWIVLASAAAAQAPKDPPPPEENQLPPEEDKAKIQEQYSFNPLKSNKDVSVGEFYFKKNDYKAAAGRFREATKWNDGNAEAWLRLGDAEEKMHDAKAAREAWEKYLMLAPDAKNSAEVRKKLERLK